ncbi:MAG: hypothetical protein JHC93_05050 [Parachlamydiales bacterium]|nr:hypothetical protein [Parachlamydiales bacterium]
MIFVATGCTSLTQKSNDSLISYKQRDFENADVGFSKLLDKNPGLKNRVWLLLDRGMSRFANGHYKMAALDFQNAIESSDLSLQKPLFEQMTSTVIDERLSVYTPSYVERIYSYFFCALSLLKQNDISNAIAVLKSAHELEIVEEEKSKNTHFFTGFIPHVNTAGNELLSNLLRLQDDLSNVNQLDQKVKDSGFASCFEKQKVVLYVFRKPMPAKVTLEIPAIKTSLYVLEMIIKHKAPMSILPLLPSVKVPSYPPIHHSTPSSLKLGNKHIKSQRLASIDRQCESYLNLMQPTLVAKEVAKYLLQRTTVNVIHNNNKSALADLGFFIMNMTSKPDLRSWQTLPTAIDTTQLPLPVGDYTLSIKDDDIHFSIKDGQTTFLIYFEET